MADHDPVRLVDDGSPLARSLLAAAAGDTPEGDRRAAIGKRLGITAAVLASSTKASAVTGGAAVWWKLGALAVLLAGATGIAIVTRDAPTPPPSMEVAPVAPVAPPVAQVAPPAPRIEVAPPVVEASAPPAVVETTPPAPAEKPRRPRRAKVVVEPPTDTVVEPAAPAPVAIDARRLALEVGLLDSARAALRGGDPTGALALLARHDREFADGVLVAEAEVVRIEALVKRGDLAAARTRADDFASRFPRSPLLRRVRSLVKEEP